MAVALPAEPGPAQPPAMPQSANDHPGNLLRQRPTTACWRSGIVASSAAWLRSARLRWRGSSWCPEKAGDAGSVQSWLLRYAHSVRWALLAVAAGGWAVRAPRPATQRPARAALAAYVTFLAALAV